MTNLHLAQRMALTTTLLLSAATLTMASQTFVLRSGSPHRALSSVSLPSHQPESRTESDTAAGTGNPWASRIEIYDPDDGSEAPTETTSKAAGSPKAVALAHRYLHYRYVWGSQNPSRGFDCSGFVRYIYMKLGKSLPRTASEQFHVGQHIRTKDLKPGDILFFHTSRRGVSHVGLYVGSGRFIHAANPRKGVVYGTLTGYYAKRLVGARRVK